MTDPQENRTEYRYNAANQPEQITDCSGRRTRLNYTADGQLAAVTDELGQRNKFSKHSLDRDPTPQYNPYNEIFRIINKISES